MRRTEKYQVPTQSDAIRLLDRLFDKSPIDNRLIAAVIDKLADKDLSMAMVVIEVLLDEAGKRLPDDEREMLLREFAELARPEPNAASRHRSHSCEHYDRTDM